MGEGEDMEERIKEIFMKLGADLCGIAGADRFGDTPEGFRPADIYSECRSVVVFAKALPKGTAKVDPRIIYQHFNSMGPVELDRIAYNGAFEIEKEFGGIAVPLPSDGPYDSWDAEKLEGRGLISMKHAAVMAGIGSLGKNTLLMNRTYGNMISVGAVLTDMDLASDPFAEEFCMKSCRLCVESCPVNAIGGGTVSQYLCRTHAYGNNSRGFPVVNCNRCRVVCPLAFGAKK